MTSPTQSSWQRIHDTVLHRIRSGEWKPGDAIPNEAQLAEEFDCARATVNRALRELAEAGLLERRRKAGTRVAPFPTRRARLHIPLVREEIEAKGARYGYRLLHRESRTPPPPIAARMGSGPGEPIIHLSALHLADDAPYAHEDRWINPASIAGVEHADFEAISPNEWLVRNAPFTEGEISLLAERAPADTAHALGVEEAAALFVLERMTRTGTAPITFVRLSYAPGYRMNMTL